MLRFLTLLLLLPILSVPACAEENVQNTQIVFGQTAALTGPVSMLGTDMRNGILAAFKEANEAGGIKGRLLALITRDDGYEPESAITNIKQLLNEDNVFALIGGVGTPTANAVLPLIKQEQIPFIAPFTGAEFLRDPYSRLVVNIRASYMQETEEWIERLTTDLGIKRIAIFYQDDTYGMAGLAGVQKALEKRGLPLVAQGTYKRNTLAVKRAVLEIMEAQPEAIVMVGAYKPCAAFIKLSKQLGVKTRFINISFVGSEALAKELGGDGEGVIVSQVVPFPFDPSSPLVKSYQVAIKRLDPKINFGFVSLEGYLAGRLAVDVLRKISGEITRSSFLDTLYQHKVFQMDDVAFVYGAKRNQGTDKVYFTILGANGAWSSITKFTK